jgi:hypothetical protein
MIGRNNRPFYERPDLTPYLVHLTKNTIADNEYSAFENLRNILLTGRINGSTTEKGFIKGPHPAACFMDIPFASLKYVLNDENSDPDHPRYEPFGLLVTKVYAYRQGCRPVLYLSNEETRKLDIPTDELWRVVRLEGVDGTCINWVHEREWRHKGTFRLPREAIAVLVKDVESAKRLQDDLADTGHKFKTRPSTILPLSVMCQGLTNLTIG